MSLVLAICRRILKFSGGHGEVTFGWNWEMSVVSVGLSVELRHLDAPMGRQGVTFMQFHWLSVPTDEVVLKMRCVEYYRKY